jgi:predicted O-methyltransferase YrrM
MLRVLLRARLALRDRRADHAGYLAWLGHEFQADAGALDAEYEDGAFRRDYLARLAGLHAAIGPQRIGTSDEWCLRALYLLVRAARPRVVVETGVLYGASSAHLLAALDANGEGELYSIDLAHAADEPPADHLVPERLANRWTLVEGDSRRELPLLLRRLRQVDLFHHDSLHTFEHMTWEYQTALPCLARHGVLSSHDVLWGHSLRRILRRNAFPLFLERNALRWQTFQNNGFARRAEPAGG